MTTNKNSKMRSRIVEFANKLLKQKTQAAKGSFLEFMKTLVDGNMISSQFFQKHFFDSFVQIIDDNAQNQMHLRVLRDLSKKVINLLFDDKTRFDKFNHVICLLKSRCDSKIDASNINPEKKLRSGDVVFLIAQHIGEYDAFISRPELKDEVKEYLRTVDMEKTMQEEILSGTYIPSKSEMTIGSLKEEYGSMYSQATRASLQKNSSRNQLDKNNHHTKNKKSFSVRSSSKHGNRQKLPPSTQNKDKPNALAGGNPKEGIQNKQIQQPLDVLDR